MEAGEPRTAGVKMCDEIGRDSGDEQFQHEDIEIYGIKLQIGSELPRESNSFGSSKKVYETNLSKSLQDLKTFLTVNFQLNLFQNDDGEVMDSLDC